MKIIEMPMSDFKKKLRWTCLIFGNILDYTILYILS